MNNARVIPLHLRISQAFLVLGDRPILVDTGGPSDAETILKRLAEQCVRVEDLALILHTHGHQDHCGSTAVLRARTSAPAAIHSLDAFMARQGHNGPLRFPSLLARLIVRLVDRPFPPFEPDILLAEEASLAAFGVDGRIVFTPGHTAGSISLVLGSGEAIVGDLLVGGYLGGVVRPGQPGYPYAADDLDVLRASVQKVLDLRPSKLFVGHGGPLEPGRVQRWLQRART
jgi:hydroxyacylglutathione hydrolase